MNVNLMTSEAPTGSQCPSHQSMLDLSEIII